jgi:hypothetical protein
MCVGASRRMSLKTRGLLASLLLACVRMASSIRAQQSNRCEVLIGRSLAACVHPFAAWRSRARSFRVLVLAGYFTAGYLTVLMTMVFLA